jgi:hypothetical protein
VKNLDKQLQDRNTPDNHSGLSGRVTVHQTPDYLSMPLVAASVLLVVLQQARLTDPQLAHLWVTAVVACLPPPTMAIVVLHPSQLCEMTVLVGTP